MSADNRLIVAPDGLPANIVGSWCSEKHDYLCRYITISSGARSKFLGNFANGTPKAGASYIDLFCATGKACIRKTGHWVDGGAVTAWKESVAKGKPFTKVFINDLDTSSVEACKQRLLALNAPVVAMNTTAIDAAARIAKMLNPEGLHLAFIDPYNLHNLDFSIIQGLSAFKRMDLIIHLSASDLRRNLWAHQKNGQAFDSFAPGWRNDVNVNASRREVLESIVAYWRNQVSNLGKWPSTRQKAITNSRNSTLYWLLLASSNEMAHKFWETAINPQNQAEMLF